jgi:hypothetical protein
MSDSENLFDQDPSLSGTFGPDAGGEGDIEEVIRAFRFEEDLRWMLRDAELAADAKAMAAEGGVPPLSVEEMIRHIAETMEAMRDRRDGVVRRNGSSGTTSVEDFREYNQWHGGALALSALLRAFKARNGDL